MRQEALTPEAIAAMDAPGTEPRYFVRIDLDQEYHYSTREEAEVDEVLYQTGFVRALTCSPSEASFQLWNEDFRHTMNAMNGVYLSHRVTIYWVYSGDPRAHYVTPGYWQEGYTEGPLEGVAAAFVIFDGVIHATPDVDDWLTVQARRETPRTYPNLRMKPPFANFLPSEGYTLQFDGQVLRIEGQR